MSGERDLAPVTLTVRVPNVLVVKPDGKFASAAELAAFSKANPKEGTFSSSGVGNPQHLAGELMNKMAGSHLLHVSYRGAAQQIPDVLAGSVKATFASYLAVASFVAARQLTTLGSPQRSAFPVCPTCLRSPRLRALQDSTSSTGSALFAPAKTPPATLATVHDATEKVLRNPAIASKLETLGSYPEPMSQQPLARFVSLETAKFKEIVAAAGILPQ